MSLTINIPIQVGYDDWEDIPFEIDSDRLEDYMDSYSKEENIGFMKSAWDKFSKQEKEDFISNYKDSEYINPETNEPNYEYIFEEDKFMFIEDFIMEVVDEIEDDLIRDFKDEAEEDYEFSQLDDYAQRGISPSDFH